MEVVLLVLMMRFTSLYIISTVTKKDCLPSLVESWLVSAMASITNSSKLHTYSCSLQQIIQGLPLDYIHFIIIINNN